MPPLLKVALGVLWFLAFGAFLVFAGAVILFVTAMDPTR
jgi:hypothetical protein